MAINPQLLNALANPQQMKIADPMEQYGAMLKNAMMMGNIQKSRQEQYDIDVMDNAAKLFPNDPAGFRSHLAQNRGSMLPIYDEQTAKIGHLKAQTGKETTIEAKTHEELMGERYKNSALRMRGVSTTDPVAGYNQYAALLGDEINDPVTVEDARRRKIDPYEVAKRTLADAKQHAMGGPDTWGRFVLGQAEGLKVAMQKHFITSNVGGNTVTQSMNAFGDPNPQTISNLKHTIDPSAQMLEGGRNSRNADDNATSRANTFAHIASSEGIAARGVASREGLAKMGFDIKRWETDKKYSDEMMTRGSVASQILKREFPWVHVGTIGKRSLKEQQSLWEGSGRNPFMAAKPGTSLHGLGAAIDYGHAKDVSPDEMRRFHERAAELGIQMYDETHSRNGSHQHGTILNPPDLATLRQIYKGDNTFVTDENDRLVKKAEGVKVRPRAAQKMPNFQNMAVTEFNAIHRDNFMSPAQREAEVERLRLAIEARFKGAPQASPTPGATMPTQDEVLRTWNAIQEERLRQSQIDENNSRARSRGAK